MLIKTSLFILLILNTIAIKEQSNIKNSLEADYDEAITGQGERIYTGSLTKTKTFLIKRESSTKKYFEITNFYVPYELLKGEDIIYTGEDSGEYIYYFVHDGSDYYLKLTKTYYATGGFKIRSSTEQFNFILKSSLDLIVLKERSFEITLQNDKTNSQLICISIPYVFRLEVKSIVFQENGADLTTIDYKVRSYDNIAYSYYYYMILNNIITINLNLHTAWYSTITESTTFQIKIDNSYIKDISTNSVYCAKVNEQVFFNINFNSYSHFEISMKDNSKIYYLKSNEEKTELKSLSIYDKNFNKIYVDTTSSSACFYIYFLNEKFIINDNSTYSLYLFDSRNYEITIKNSKAKYFHVNFKKNTYFNFTKIVLPNQSNKEIKALYLNSSDYYVYQFEKDSNEMPINIYVEKIKSFTDYEKIEFEFYFYEEIKNINTGFFDCISEEKYFHLMPNSDKNKPYLHLKTNNTKKVLLNGEIFINENITLKDNEIYDLNIIGEQKSPVYIYLFYTEKNVLEVKKNEKYKYLCYDDMNFELIFAGLKIGYEINLRLESNSKNLNFYSVKSEETIPKSITIINSPDDLKITPKKEQVKINLRVKNTNKLSAEEFTFYFNYEEFILNDNSTNSLYLFETRDYEMTIKNSKAKYFHIKFNKNSDFNITKIVLINQNNREVKALYLNPDDYYVYQFEKESDEMPIKIYFEKLSSIDNKKMEFEFYAYNEDIKKIDKDYFEYISEEKYFYLMPNSEKKPYLHLKTNNAKNVLVNGEIFDYENIIIKENEIYYLNVIGQEEKPTYVYLYYTEKENIEVKKKDQLKYLCYDKMTYEFNLVDLKIGYEIILRMESNNKNIRFYSMELYGANKNSIYDIKNPANIKITPKEKQIKIDLTVKNDNNLLPGEFTFYFYSEKSSDYKILLSTAKIFAYICFGIVVIPFIVLCYCNGLIKDKEIKEEKKSYYSEKFAAIYFCKKYDKLE